MEHGAIESPEFFQELDDIYRQPGHLMRRKLEIVTSLIRPGKRLLDVGCGTGEALLRVQDRFEQIIGVEASSFGVRYAKRKISDKRNLSVVQGSAFRLCFKEEYFDCCLALDVLEHFEQPELALLTLAQTLKKGGQLIVTVPNWTDWIVSRLLGLNPEHRAFHTPKGWQNLINKCGFRPLRYRAVRLPFLTNDFLAQKLPYGGMCILIVSERFDN